MSSLQTNAHFMQAMFQKPSLTWPDLTCSVATCNTTDKAPSPPYPSCISESYISFQLLTFSSSIWIDTGQWHCSSWDSHHQFTTLSTKFQYTFKYLQYNLKENMYVRAWLLTIYILRNFLKIFAKVKSLEANIGPNLFKMMKILLPSKNLLSSSPISFENLENFWKFLNMQIKLNLNLQTYTKYHVIIYSFIYQYTC